MTEKLYYQDAYIKDFDANVISCAEFDGGFEVVLDRTAFFPEEGGQSADRGTIDGIPVIDVREQDGIIYHVTATPLKTGARVHCALYFDERFMKMQCHTAEHILCGIIHSLYKLNNVGFHLGDKVVTFDLDGVLTREELDRAEELANNAVFANLPVTASFPTVQELENMDFRSKMEITDGIRIVRIGDVDACACCAPHVAYTGEIGMIKMLDFAKHRGGIRIQMVAGSRALFDYREKYSNVHRISAYLSEPQESTADAVLRATESIEEYKSRIKYQGLEIAALRARLTDPTDGNALYLLDGMNMDQLREFSNVAMKRVGGILIVLTGTDGDYRYVIASEHVDVSGIIRDINAALGGKGGGKGNMVQGSFYTDLDSIKSYFHV